MSHLDAATLPETPLLRIQEAAADVGLTTRSIRYYEELGLLKPAARSEGSYRLYDADDVERLRFIKGLRDDEAARARNRERFRETTDPIERRALIHDAFGQVDRQIGTLEAKIERLQAMVAEARQRRAHLESHLAEIDTGREPTPHSHPATGTAKRRR
jgi:DNA-binding transcriptional MerR regulator